MQKKEDKIVDIGTGAGTIPLALGKELGIDLFASDISKKALNTAKKNAKMNGIKITFKKGSLLEPWKNYKFDIITANLPYIPTEDMGGLALDIHHYEPRIALEGGEGGLKIYEEFIKQIPMQLKEKGKVFCEIGKGQGKSFCKIVKKYFPDAKCEIKKDIAGIDRLVILTFD